MDTWRPDTLRLSLILSSGTSNASASSSADGGLSYSCSSFEKALLILLSEPTWFNGSLTILACSANA